MVFQLQFALFQAAQLQLVGVTVTGQHVYDSVEVAMFHVEFDNAAMDLLDVDHRSFRQWLRAGVGKMRGPRGRDSAV